MLSLARPFLLLAAAWFLFASSPAQAQGQGRAIPGELLVRYKTGVGPSERASLRAQMNAHALQDFDFINVEHVRLERGDVVDVIRRFGSHPRIEYVEANYELHADLTPNDPRFPEMYALRNTGQTGGTAGADIKATSAWDLFTGDPNLLIGVIDTGIDYNHPDLAANAWTNPGEIPGNGVDDELNGYVDDVHGYDFVNNDGDPFDDNGHGTHCAGTIAGVGNNNLGVAGVVWRAKVAGIKFLSAAGSGSTANAIAGIQYAIRIGCRVTSNSWGGGGFSQALLDAINAAGAVNQLFIAAAGNSSANTDVTPHYPSAYNTPFVIAVAATDHNDNLASFSNYGATTVDLAAPGVSILSLQPGGNYRLLSGTSMATPHVAGATALAMGRFPALTNLQVKNLILTAVDVKSQLAGRCLTGGRLNAFMTIAEPDSVPPGGIADLLTLNAGSNTMGLRWTATGDDGATGRAASYEIRYSTAPIDADNFASATLVAGPDPQPAGSTENLEVGGLAFSTTYYFALRARDEFQNPGPISNVAVGTTLGIPDLTATPVSFSTELLTGAAQSQTLTLRNDGQGTLDFTIPSPQLQFGQPVSHPPVEIAKGEDDWRIGDPVVDGQGGPDAFGYRWIDSNEPGGPAFQWVDISTIGTQIPLTVDDGFAAAIPMGMSFPFYGSAFNTLRLHSNGFLSFTTTTGDFYDNQPLPSTGGAANLVAPFWDDLDFRTTAGSARAYYYHDGSRLIVSWVNVPHFVLSGTPTGPYTFQAILYPTGEIRFQYLSMNPPTNSATVGIQNATRDIGLNVAFNTNYVQNGLAIRMLPLRQWLTVNPTAGRIHAGQSLDVEVSFNALGLNGGNYAGTIQVESNDPDGDPTDVSASMHVIGAPDIQVSRTSLAFGDVFVGATPSQVVTVSNPGTEDLVVSAIASNHPSVTVDAGSFTLAPQAARNLTVTFAPTAVGAVNAVLDVQSNDPDAANVAIGVTGNGVPAPSFAVNPDSLHVTLLTNTATSRTLRVSNNGGSNYVFTVSAEVLGQSGTVLVHGDADNVDLPKDAPDVQSGPAPLRADGPDVFGYTYQDSDEPGGPTFVWQDISAVGTPIPLNGDDQNLGPFPIGFDFPFYGNTFNTFRICSNGFLSFTSTRTTFTNTSLPNTGSTVPENLLAVYWDDLDYRPASAPNGRAYYHYDGVGLIVQYQNVPKRGDNANRNTFQVHLFPNGMILYQYLDMPMVTKNSGTIGIQNATKNDGLQVVFNANYIKDDLAIRFRPPARYLTVSPNGGTVPPAGFLDLGVGFNAAGLLGGEYFGRIHIDGNDPILPQKDVPANLTVTGVPDLAVSPPSLDFGEVFIGYPQLHQLVLSNIGTGALQVTDITLGDPAYGVDATNFTIPALGAAIVFVSFNPTAVGSAPATLTVHSNDPDTPQRAVALSGIGLVAPDIEVAPASLAETLEIPGAVSRAVTVHNQGGSDLDFQVSVNLISGASTTSYQELELGKDDPDPSPGVLGTGGPDLFGYRWADSDQLGGPAFSWVDISAIGTQIPLVGDDQNLGPFPIGFSFPFYGTSFDSLRVCSNGWLSFTSTRTTFTNTALPSTGSTVPENLLAAFWDDLDFRPATAPNARAYYHNDGGRLIVSYVNVPRRTSGGPYTFQVILHPSGRIDYQYLSMQGTRLSEATIGMQNAARNIGLTVVHNAALAHDGMAVRFVAVPNYLTTTPTSGTVPAGGSAEIQVAFNSAGMFDGVYQGSLRVSSNDPATSEVLIPTQLTALGTPDIAALPPALDFGPVYVSLSKDLSVTIRNIGSKRLTLSGASTDDADYAIVAGPSFPIHLALQGSTTFIVRFAPAAGCDPCGGNLLVSSNDPDTPQLAVALTGVGVVPPEIEWTPASLRAALATTLGPTAIRTTKQLVIENTGGSDLTWSARTLTALPDTLHGPEGVEDKDHVGEPGSPTTAARGGPDAFGYRWMDSNDSLGTPFQWIDITGIGTPLDLPSNGDDQNVQNIPIGFSFPFYDRTFDKVNVCTNGWISFTSTRTNLGNIALPNAGSTVPENLLAVFWDDLDPDTLEPKIYVHGDPSRFVVSWVNVLRFSTGGPYTFQAILYPNGTIDYQYLDMRGTRLDEATVGIQNATKNIGLTVVHNADYVQNQLRIRISASPGWLTLSPTTGTTPAGGRDTVLVTYDAAGLGDGDYQGLVRIASNDLTDPVTEVPARLHVGVLEATFELDPGSLNRASNGNWVMGMVAPPDPCVPPNPCAPQDLRISSLLIERQVPVDPSAPFSYQDGSGHFKFDRAMVQALLSEGESVPVELIGEVTDVTWFADHDTIRVLRPRMTSAQFTQGGRTVFEAGSKVWLEWLDPAGGPATGFEMYYSFDGGDSWSTVFTNMAERRYHWTVPGLATTHGRLDLVAVDALGPMGTWSSRDIEVVSGVTGVEDRLPERFGLAFLGPNPAPGGARLELALPTASAVDVRVHDLRGAVVRSLAGGEWEAGRHLLAWDGRDASGHRAPAGVYFVRAATGDRTANLRFVLLP